MQQHRTAVRFALHGIEGRRDRLAKATDRFFDLRFDRIVIKNGFAVVIEARHLFAIAGHAHNIKTHAGRRLRRDDAVRIANGGVTEIH